MQKNIRRIALLLALSMLISSLGACTLVSINDPYAETMEGDFVSTDASTEESTSPDEDQDKQETYLPYEKDGMTALNALRESNLNQSTLLIATTDTSHAFSQDQDGTLSRSDSIYAERAKRINWVEEKYNARIVTFTYTEDALYCEIEKSKLSDTQYVSDYYAIPAHMLGKLCAGDFLMNLRSLPFTDYTQPYFDGDAMNAMSAAYDIYAVSGDFTQAYDELSAIYFNKDLVSDDLYQTVANGTWTWEKYFAYAKEATNETSGVSGDNLGLLSLADVEMDMWGSIDFHPIRAGLDAQPKLRSTSTVTDALQSMADLLFKNVYKKETTLPLEKDTENDGGTSRFTDGKTLFYHGALSKMYDWADISVNWGILPLPKFNESQKGYRTGADQSSVLCVPFTVVESDKTGLILQALFASSYHAYKDLYLTDALAYYIRDEKTADMLDIIVSGTSFDFSVVMASGYPEISAATLDTLHETVTSKSSARSLFKKTKGALEKLLSASFYADR